MHLYDAMNIRLEIDAVETPIAEFFVPEMGLSSARSTMTRHEFKLRLHADDVSHHLEGEYARWIDASKMDDNQFGAPQDGLAEAGYPDLATVLRDERLLKLVVGDYLFSDLIMKFRDPACAVRYWVDHVSRCELESNVITITGSCYR
jgi:hypothetical protein